jgi:hypothetical protein
LKFESFKIYKKVGQIHGKGRDAGGDYEIKGIISASNLCQFVKRYPSTNQEVFYSGLYSKPTYDTA